MRKLILVTTILTVFNFSTNAFAHGGHHETHDHKTTSKLSYGEALSVIQSSVKSIGEIINNSSGDIHNEIDKIKDASDFLKDSENLENDKRTRLESALKQLNSQLDKVHTELDRNDIEKARAEYKKAQGALRLVETNLNYKPYINSVKLELIPSSSLKVNKSTQVKAKLITNRSLTFDDLKEAHTKKLHLLIIDPTLSDYHHIHPQPGTNPSEFVFDFTPKKDSGYRVWADIIPVSTDKQEYVMSDIGTTSGAVKIDKTVNMVSKVEDYTFTLVLDGEPKVGEAIMGNITVTKNGKPFNQLEPIMGAFAHVVGFSEDYESILHIHPMGKEPSSNVERGGPKLEFHIEPKKAGFIKLFAQVKIGGKEIFAPFGLIVK